MIPEGTRVARTGLLGRLQRGTVVEWTYPMGMFADDWMKVNVRWDYGDTWPASITELSRVTDE